MLGFSVPPHVSLKNKHILKKKINKKQWQKQNLSKTWWVDLHPKMSILKNKGGNFKFTADLDKCANLSQAMPFSKEVNSVARGSSVAFFHDVPASHWGRLWCSLCRGATHLPGSHCQRKSSPSLHLSTSCTKSESLQKYTSVYHSFFSGGQGWHWFYVLRTVKRVSPELTPPIWYQKLTHSVLGLPLWTGEARNPLAPAARKFAPVFAIM